MECSICLQKMNPEKHCIKTLSCGHKLHNSCYMKLVFNYGNLFIKCPLCRETNVCNKKSNNDPLLDLKEICISTRCQHITREGKRCKKKSFILNDGCCKMHSKNYLSEDKYEIIRDFIYWILMTGNKKKTKMIMIDVSKKLLLKYPNIKNIYDIQYYFHKYYHLHNIMGGVVQWRELYNYFQLEPINEELLLKSITENTIY